MAIDTPIHTNEQSIERVLSAGAPALLVFWRRGSALQKVSLFERVRNIDTRSVASAD